MLEESYLCLMFCHVHPFYLTMFSHIFVQISKIRIPIELEVHPHLSELPNSFPKVIPCPGSIGNPYKHEVPWQTIMGISGCIYPNANHLPKEIRPY